MQSGRTPVFFVDAPPEAELTCMKSYGGLSYPSAQVFDAIRPCVRPSVRPSMIHVVVLFPRYLQYLLTDFRQTFVTGASWDTDDLITFLGQKVKVQGHTIAAEAHSARRYRRVQLFLVTICILASRVRNPQYIIMFRVASRLYYCNGVAV